MGIKTVPQPPYSRDLAPCDFWLFPKHRGCRYETMEELKEAVTKVIDTLTQEDFHGAFQKLLERYNKCIVAGGDYFEGDKSFMCVLSIKVRIRKKSGNLLYAPRISNIYDLEMPFVDGVSKRAKVPSLHTVKWFQVLLCFINNTIRILVICLRIVKWSNRSISNNSIYRKFFVCTQLKCQMINY